MQNCFQLFWATVDVEMKIGALEIAETLYKGKIVKLFELSEDFFVT